MLLDWESKEALLEASYQKTRESVSLPSPSALPPLCVGLTSSTIISYSELDTIGPSYSSSRLLFPLACPAHSPLRHGLPPPTAPHHQFITPSSHRRAQNPCFHPTISDGHGFLVDEKGDWTDPKVRFGADAFVPVLAMSKVEGMGDIGGIPFDLGDFEGEHIDTIQWEDKTSEKLYWVRPLSDPGAAAASLAPTNRSLLSLLLPRHSGVTRRVLSKTRTTVTAGVSRTGPVCTRCSTTTRSSPRSLSWPSRKTTTTRARARRRFWRRRTCGIGGTTSSSVGDRCSAMHWTGRAKRCCTFFSIAFTTALSFVFVSRVRQRLIGSINTLQETHQLCAR